MIGCYCAADVIVSGRCGDSGFESASGTPDGQMLAWFGFRLTAEMNRLNDRLADVSDAGLGLVGEVAKQQIVTELLEHFGQAQERFAAL